MIAQAQQYSSLIVLRDRHGDEVGTLSIGDGIFLGHSRDYVVIQYGDMIVTMDENQRNLGSVVLDQRYRIQGITESGFYAKVDNAVIMYDKFCNKKDQYAV